MKNARSRTKKKKQLDRKEKPKDTRGREIWGLEEEVTRRERPAASVGQQA